MPRSSSIAALENDRPTTWGSVSLTVTRNERGGELVAWRVRLVVADQVDVHPVEALAPTHRLPQHGEGALRLGVDVEAGEDEGHGVAEATVVGDGHLQFGRRRLATHPGEPDPVRPHLLEVGGVEARHRVRRQVGGRPDLVEELGCDRADRDATAGARLLRDRRGAVGLHLGDGEAREPGVGQLVHERSNCPR